MPVYQKYIKWFSVGDPVLWMKYGFTLRKTKRAYCHSRKFGVSGSSLFRFVWKFWFRFVWIGIDRKEAVDWESVGCYPAGCFANSLRKINTEIEKQ